MQRISVSDLYEQNQERVLFDARTPAEYTKGHLPEAINLPLFSDEERVVVGTLYKQENPEIAFIKGLDFAGARLSSYVKNALRYAPNRKVAIYCWRGGKRSGSLAWLLDIAGFDVQILDGGYKAYRQFVRAQFSAQQLPLLVLGGKTGSGKTAILHHLRGMNEQVLDLEGLAHHKGSAFGALGESPQPSIEQFENELYQAIRTLDLNRRIWVESESRLIGKVYLPDGFWQQHEAAPIICLNVSDDYRVQRLVDDYAQYPKTDLIAVFEGIKKRLGGQRLQSAVQALEQNDYASAARTALEYYDKAYLRSRGKENATGTSFHLQVNIEQAVEIAKQLIEFANEQNFQTHTV